MSGIHHVTAIAGNALRNYDFYTRALGLRFVKKTVNFDDPGTYHFYFGDDAGRPGSILTFFPWEHADEGRAGVGETQETAFRIPEASIGYWTGRLIARGLAPELPADMRRSNVMCHAIHPSTHRAAAVKMLKTAPQPEVDVLQQVTPLFRICFVRARQPAKCRNVI